MPENNSTEDGSHRRVGKVVDIQGVEVSNESTFKEKIIHFKESPL
jgi:hypothetical protein